MKRLHLFESFNATNDLKKFYLFSHSDRFSFSHIDSLVRSVAGDIFMFLMPPGIFPKSIDPNIPVFNYGNTPELQELIDSGFILEKNVYNLPKNLVNANSKVEFHKKTEGLDYVPKTVFKKEEAAGLKFPIIAKPSGGSKGEGIKVFKTKEELDSSTDAFDLFSEKFDLKREFRIISIKGEMVFIAERIPENDKANSLRENQHENKDIFDREGTLSGRSSYKWVKVEFGKDIPEEKAFQDICRSINEALSLEFLGVDIGLDSSGKLWCIEANTCPGLNKDQIVLIYIALFKDFYKKEPNEQTMKTLNQYRDELMRANEDPAKFSFSPHQGNRFYYYNDIVDHETGERKGRSLLTMKYNIEKSFGNTMLNIKKNESKIKDFKGFNKINENENEVVMRTEKPDVAQIIEDIVTGKLKPEEVSPKDNKDKTKFSFTEPEGREDDGVSETAEFYLPNQEMLVVNFTWAYDFQAGAPGDGHITPDDPDEYLLSSLELDEVLFYYNDGGEEINVELTPKITNMLKEYIEKFLPVSDETMSYSNSRKKEKEQAK